MPLARQQDKTPKVAQRIDHGQDLGRQAAAGAADGLSLSPSLAPVPCWCTRTMVPSMIAYSKSASPDKAVNTWSKTPALAHRRKRWNTEFQQPNEAGRSRQGAPARTIQSTASTNRRLFTPDRPGSPAFQGRRGAIRSH